MAIAIRDITVTLQVPNVPPRIVLTGHGGEYEILHGVRHVSVFPPYQRHDGGPGRYFRYRITAKEHSTGNHIEIDKIEFIGFAPHTEAARFADQLVEQLAESSNDSHSAEMIAEDKTVNRLSNFGVVGYGYDVIAMRPKESLTQFTYRNSGQTIKWNGEEIIIPDQIIFSETPTGHEITANFSNKITTAREFQNNMEAKVGLQGTDPETDLTFKGDANFVNELFLQTDHIRSLELYEADYDFVFLQLKNIQLEKCILPEVNDAAIACGLNHDLIANFYDTFGTHVVTSADVGGQMHIRTMIKLDAQTSKQISEQKLDITGQVKDENDDYVSGGLGFKNRDENTSKLYREVSKKDISLLGGKVTSLDAGEWRATLMESAIPTQKLSFVNKNVIGHGFVANVGNAQNQNLGLINLKYTEIFKILNISENQKLQFKRVLKDYLSGVNPFDNTPQRLKPDMDESDSLKEKQKTTFQMRGWLATYETYAGLNAKPGARATVRCKSDAEPGGWTEAIIYAGEKLQLRGKTPYLSAYMVVEFVKAYDDEDAIVFAENKLVSW